MLCEDPLQSSQHSQHQCCSSRVFRLRNYSRNHKPHQHSAGVERCFRTFLTRKARLAGRRLRLRVSRRLCPQRLLSSRIQIPGREVCSDVRSFGWPLRSLNADNSKLHEQIRHYAGREYSGARRRRRGGHCLGGYRALYDEGICSLAAVVAQS